MSQSKTKNILAVGHFNLSLAQNWNLETDLKFNPKQRISPKPDVLIVPYDTSKTVRQYRHQAYFNGVGLWGAFRVLMSVGLTSLFSADGLDGWPVAMTLKSSRAVPQAQTGEQPKSKNKTGKVTTSAETVQGYI